MSWHKVWLVKCDGSECEQGHITRNPDEMPEGWGSDGSQHACASCLAKQIPSPEDPEGSDREVSADA